tara:strand:+ start:1775 stop:2509 length:735 start_codon:yes stop_codon:yes gene_type:complete
MGNLLKINHITGNWQNSTDKSFSVGIYDSLQLNRQLQGVNRLLGRAISHTLSAGLIKGKLGEIHRIVGKKGTVAYVYGLGKKGQLTPEDLRIAGAGVAKACIADRIESVTFMMPIEAKDALMSQAASEGIVLGSYQFNEFKSNNDEAFELKRASIFGGVDKSIQKGAVIASSVCFARDLENRPGNIATPTHLAENAKDISRDSDVKVTVFDRKEFTDMGMGALAGVAQVLRSLQNLLLWNILME